MENRRKELIKICEDAVVPFHLWMNRDSFAAQMQIKTIYKGLTAGLDFTITSEDEETIHIKFNLHYTNERKLKEFGKNLEISSREDYFKLTDFNNEMFDSNGIDFNSSYLEGYMPTRKQLDLVKGEDWY